MIPQTNPIVFSSSQTPNENPSTADFDRISLIYKDNKKINDQVSENANYLVSENQRLNAAFIEKNNVIQDLQNNLLQKDVLIGEKNKEIHYLSNKIAFMENELSTRYQNNNGFASPEARLQELNERIFEMSKDLMEKTEENNNFREQYSELKIRSNDQNDLVQNLKEALRNLEMTNGNNFSEIINLRNETQKLQNENRACKENLGRLLEENEKLQRVYQDSLRKNEDSWSFLDQELQRKNFAIGEYEELIRNANSKIGELEEEIAKLTLQGALGNLQNEEKFKEEKEKLQEIASTTEIVQNLNVLLAEKIEENRQLRESMEYLRSELDSKDSQNMKKSATIDKLQQGLEKLLIHVDSLNTIINNQTYRINLLNEATKNIAAFQEEIKHFSSFIANETRGNFEAILQDENYFELFSQFKNFYRDLKDEISILEERVYTMVIINENLVKILEGQPIFTDHEMITNQEKTRFEMIIQDLKKKINMILEENAKLNTAFEKVDKTRIFKSWTEGREKIENATMQNELALAKKNIVLLLKTNKELLEKYKAKTENNSNPTIFTNENKEKYLFQINSLKKQNDILKEMNKNRGMVIENLLKKLKNQRI